MIDYKTDESDASPNHVEENGRKRKRGGNKQEIIVRLWLEEDQEQQLQALLMESENNYIQTYVFFSYYWSHIHDDSIRQSTIISISRDH